MKSVKFEVRSKELIMFLTGEGADESSRQRWPALESNPEVLSNFLLGVGAPATYAFVDVYGLDEEILGMVPQVSGFVPTVPFNKSYLTALFVNSLRMLWCSCFRVELASLRIQNA